MGDISVLTQAGCRTRQERLRALLERHGLDATILYDKNEMADLTTKQRGTLKTMIKAELEMRRKK